MNRNQLFDEIKRKQSFLCVGLDTDKTKLPQHLLTHPDPVFEFNKQIIAATEEFCVAYKPNLAFYEADGIDGMRSLQKTMQQIPQNCFTIADAKRGDIGNTSAMYARSFFEYYGFDSITVAPYMGSDSVKPFLTHPRKWVILLALTSNPGAEDFQHLKFQNGEQLYESVLRTSSTWGNADNMMYVVGATRADKLAYIRTLIPHHFLLVPGIGAQGGSLADVAKYGMNEQCGLLVNASRSILYASSGEDFAEKARQEAKSLQSEMQKLLDQYC
jgi:orotidine-5'-phosphate decarboxylase